MNLVAKIRSLQKQVDELRVEVTLLRTEVAFLSAPAAEIDQTLPAVVSGFSRVEPLTKPIAVAEPIASATIAPPPAKRRGRPPKPKV